MAKVPPDFVEDLSTGYHVRSEIETVESNLEPDPSCCFDDDTSNRDCGPDDNWGPDDNDNNCEDNDINTEMPNDSYFLREVEELVEGCSMTLSTGDKIKYTSTGEHQVRRSKISSVCLDIVLMDNQVPESTYPIRWSSKKTIASFGKFE